ncbi:MAG: type II/IV secretion system protein [Polyangiaceae bacterium]|nr:type II/IV secretion system protein [Polyangiaceae bacterium]
MMLVLALLVAVASAGLELFRSDAVEAQPALRSLESLGARAFGHGGWPWLPGLAGGLVVLALIASFVEMLPVAEVARRRHFARLTSAGVREALVEVKRRIEEHASGTKPSAVGVLDELLRGAVAVSASDIHLSPSAGGVCATYRVHGAIHEVAELDLAMLPLLTTRVKVLARLDIAMRGVPQDGRLVRALDGVEIEARVSTLPTESGERVVLRLVRGGVEVPDLLALGFSTEIAAGLRELLAKPQGLLFVTGPVGSGKTTTLYAAMKHVAETRGRMSTLVTLEDPIELELAFATQTQMNPRAGMTFAGTLRSVLRQDPNVLMLGEIRDRETAEIAMQAGLTGHLILTTVHGEGAAGPFARLMEMGVEPFAVASATVGCLSQRLVRVLCVACRRAAVPEPMFAERFARLGFPLPSVTFYESVGCEHCEGQGYTGRAPLGELLFVDAALRQAIHTRVGTAELDGLARAAGMKPLLSDGLERACRGETSLAEVLRVAG